MENNVAKERDAASEASEKKHKITLPDYTKGEEIFNAVTHIVGGAFGIAALISGLIAAVMYSDAYGIASMAIYGVSLILMYTMSSIYHFLRPNKAKRVFRVLDHCSIFLLIAGTYTPMCLIVLRNQGIWGWLLFGIVWGLAVVGVTLNAVMMNKVKVLSMICYIGMGWCVVIALIPLLKVFPFAGFMWLLGGGIAYTLGAVLYIIGKKKKIKYFHSVWHIFILIGSVLQFVSIMMYAVIV